MKLIIFIGSQASGKSTFYHQHFKDTHLRLNGDMLKTKHRQKLLFEACLHSKTPTVLDKINLTIDERQPLIAQAHAHRFTVIAYYFDTPLDMALSRNGKRLGKQRVPDVAVKGCFKQLQKPTYAEGFKDIFVVTNDDNQVAIKRLEQEST